MLAPISWPRLSARDSHVAERNFPDRKPSMFRVQGSGFRV